MYDKTLATCNSSDLLYEAPIGIIFCNGGEIRSQMESVMTSNKLGAILVSSVPIILLELRKFMFPCVVIREEEAPIVTAYAEEVSRPNVSMKFKETIQEIKNAPMVPAHSARDPSPSFPIILGASIPEEVTAKIGLKPLKSNYNVVSRTSIACLMLPDSRLY